MPERGLSVAIMWLLDCSEWLPGGCYVVAKTYSIECKKSGSRSKTAIHFFHMETDF